ncbi:hypothetical protein [Nocardia sp. NPDC050710]|uniref:hypothetical protein n=1 Tax=Nocardia sp. NPDC050710 TaxID=3157220 RepID=UPI0033E23EDE
MADPVREIELIFEEHDRQARLLSEEFMEIERRCAERERDFQERTNASYQQLLEDHAEEIAKAEAEAEEKERGEMEARAEQERLMAEAREQREAVARSVAARKSKDVVYPVDDDDDPEAEYYRRKSWLV